jgi:hypothetical protein
MTARLFLLIFSDSAKTGLSINTGISQHMTGNSPCRQCRYIQQRFPVHDDHEMPYALWLYRGWG